METPIRGHLILLMAPSGSGKGKLIEGLGDLREQMYFAKTYTTRKRREGTDENPLYTFVGVEEFEKMIEEKAFVEWAQFSGNLYGTPKTEIIGPLAEGKVVFKEMELQGITQMKNILGEEHMTIVYIEAGDWETLKRRITNRAPITEEALKLRHERYIEESKTKDIANVVIENRDGELEKAQQTFRDVVQQILNKVNA